MTPIMGPADTAEAFFAANPCELGDLPSRVTSFVSQTAAGGRRMVCVTSGGTTVPLERNCVRFIDNFSRGSRGALSGEEFLKVKPGIHVSQCSNIRF